MSKRQVHPVITQGLWFYSCVLGRSVRHGKTPEEAYATWARETHPGRMHIRYYGFKHAIIRSTAP